MAHFIPTLPPPPPPSSLVPAGAPAATSSTIMFVILFVIQLPHELIHPYFQLISLFLFLLVPASSESFWV